MKLGAFSVSLNVKDIQVSKNSMKILDLPSLPEARK